MTGPPPPPPTINLTPFYTDWLLRYSTTLNGRGGASEAPSPSTDQLPSRKSRSKDDKEPIAIRTSGEHHKLFSFYVEIVHNFFVYFFGGQFLCFCRPFRIFERYSDLNPESCCSKQERAMLCQHSCRKYSKFRPLLMYFRLIFVRRR